MDKWAETPRVIVERYSIDSKLCWSVHEINDILFRTIQAHVDPLQFELVIARTALYERVAGDE